MMNNMLVVFAVLHIDYNPVVLFSIHASGGQCI